jgi:carbamoyltransferase
VCASDEELCDTVADLLASEKVIGWFSGRMEFGPRALGARSILGDARSTAMQSVMNLKIKFRESFRPFAPAVLEECAPSYFELAPGQESPYMLLVAPVREAQRIAGNGQSDLAGLDKLKACRSTIPAVTHVDYSARVQSIDPQRHGRFRRLVEAFYAKTGCPVVINTS